MKKFLTITCLLFVIQASSQDRTLEELLNFTVGGVWTSENGENDQQPESFSSFFMEFKNWSSTTSVTADIFGVKNNGDTLQLMEVWNYINPSEQNIFLVQKTAWGSHSVGTIIPFEGKHIDIVFKTTNPDGTSYWTRDIHYLLSENEMKAETYHRSNESEEWKKANESYWIRKQLKP
jgi:hypothetical protein